MSKRPVYDPERAEKKREQKWAMIVGAMFCSMVTAAVVIAGPSTPMSERLFIIFATWIGVMGIMMAVFGDRPQDVEQIQCGKCSRIYRKVDSRMCPKCGSRSIVRLKR